MVGYVKKKKHKPWNSEKKNILKVKEASGYFLRESCGLG